MAPDVVQCVYILYSVSIYGYIGSRYITRVRYKSRSTCIDNGIHPIFKIEKNNSRNINPSPYIYMILRAVIEVVCMGTSIHVYRYTRNFALIDKRDQTLHTERYSI